MEGANVATNCWLAEAPVEGHVGFHIEALQVGQATQRTLQLAKDYIWYAQTPLLLMMLTHRDGQLAAIVYCMRFESGLA